MKYTQSTCETAASQSFSRTREHTVMAQESTLKCTVSARIHVQSDTYVQHINSIFNQFSYAVVCYLFAACLS